MSEPIPARLCAHPACAAPLGSEAPGQQRYCGPLCRNKANNSKTKRRTVRESEHGTRTGYARGCRCAKCRAYNAEYSKTYRDRQPKGPKKVRSDKGVKRAFLKFEDHGTTRGYGMFGCRCPDCRRAACDYNRQWRNTNRAKYRAAMRRAHLMNPGRGALYGARRRSAPFDADSREYSNVLMADPCSYHAGPGGTVDHIVPIKAGGDSSWDNLTAACRACNAAKGKKSLLIFMLHRLAVAA